MTTIYNFLFVLVANILLLSFVQCSTEEPASLPDNITPAKYNVELQNISGMHQSFDSIGNFLGYIVDTTDLFDIEIDLRDYKTDSLLIDGLLVNWDNETMNNIPAFYSGNSISFNYDKSTIIRNDYVRGEIQIVKDSIYIDYRWDGSDTWSTGALPIFGSLKGSGIKI